jgi:hypothetical protein
MTKDSKATGGKNTISHEHRVTPGTSPNPHGAHMQSINQPHPPFQS